jgi:hypothetical protein
LKQIIKRKTHFDKHIKDLMTCYIRLRTHRGLLETGGSKGSGQKRHVITISTVLKKNVDLSVSKIFHLRERRG